MSGMVEEEDLRPVKVERETRSVEDWVEAWWREVARAKRAWDRVRDVEEAMAQPRRTERKFSERDGEGGSAAWSTAVSTETALTTPGRVRAGQGREALRRLAARREEEMSGMVEEEDLRPVKVERETRSVEDWVEAWWREVARAKRAWDRVRDVEEAMAQPRRTERKFSERDGEGGANDGESEVCGDLCYLI
nr:hypothetical protein CFP56_07333 [Quercus suber]